MTPRARGCRVNTPHALTSRRRNLQHAGARGGKSDAFSSAMLFTQFFLLTHANTALGFINAAERPHVVCASRGGLPPSRRAAGCASCHDSARPALTGGCHITCFHSSFCSAGQAGRAGRRARSRRPATMWIIKANLAGPARPKGLPRVAEALGSPRYDLALRRASSEPAGLGVSQR